VRLHDRKRTGVERSYHSHEHDAEMHYEREHAGKVRIKVTLEREQLLGTRDPQDIADAYFEKMQDKELLGWDVAYSSVEVLEESDVNDE